MNEIFDLEKESYSLYPKCEADMHSYFVLEIDIPFQELTSAIIHDLHNKKIKQMIKNNVKSNILIS